MSPQKMLLLTWLAGAICMYPLLYDYEEKGYGANVRALLRALAWPLFIRRLR